MNGTSHIADNLKKATLELLMLRLLNERDYYIGEAEQALEIKSNNRLKFVFPYAVFMRMEKAGYITTYKKVSPDGRRRIYYSITATGKKRYWKLKAIYNQFIDTVAEIIS